MERYKRLHHVAEVLRPSLASLVLVAAPAQGRVDLEPTATSHALTAPPPFIGIEPVPPEWPIPQSAAPAVNQILPPPTTDPQERFFPLTVPVLDVDTPIGTINARVSLSGGFRVPTAELLPLLQTLFDPAQLRDVQARLRDIETIGPAEAEAANIPLRFDTARAALILAVPAAARSTTDISISQPGVVPPPSQSRVEPAGISGYLNAGLGLIHDPTLIFGRTRGTILLEGAVRLGDYVVENVALLEVGGSNDRFFNRQGTRLTRDFPEQRIRASAGDLFTSTVGFTPSIQILGASLLRNVDVFDPFRSSRPSGRQTFVLNRPSDVGIYVNGALLRQTRLPPGTYNVTNFTLSEGSNDVVVEVRDDQGQQQVFSFTNFFDADLLARRVRQWEVNAGVRADRFEQRVTYDFDEPVVSGFFRQGISDVLTAGVNGLATEESGILGGEIIAATKIGNVSFDGAGSISQGAAGGAIALTFQPRLPQRWLSQGRSLDGFVEFATREFATGSSFANGQKLRFGLRYTDIVLDGDVTVGLAATYGSSYGRISDNWDISGTAGFRVFDDIVLRATAGYRKLGNREEPAFRLSLIKTFGRRSQARVTYDSRDNRVLAEYGYRSQYGGIGTWGVNANLTRGDNEESVLDTNVDYTANRFESSFGYGHVFSDGRAGSLGRIRANVSTAIAFADGKVALGRPVRDTFAIVAAHPNLDDRQVVVAPGIDGLGDRARSGSLGPALVPDIGSYTLSRLPYNVIDLPVGYDLGTGFFEFFPPYRSGYTLQIGSERLASAFGVIVDRDGAPLSIAVGTAVSATDKTFAPAKVFTNRIGRFALSGLIPGNRYIISFDDNATSVTIDVPSDATGLVNVGTLKGAVR